jgi:peptidyl-prolyl cis-trans isomerase B (cyclophilin B)
MQRRLALLALALPAASHAQANPRVSIDTSLGRIVLELDAVKAPKTTANFVKHVKEGYYDGTIFHRVIPGFMVQGGGLLPNLQDKQKPPSIQNEANNGLKNDRGTVAMARTGDPHSASAQFFVNLVNNAPLNFRSETQAGWGYAVFGKVVEGMDVVDKIAAVRTTSKAPYDDVPVETVMIKKASLVAAAPAGKKP